MAIAFLLIAYFCRGYDFSNLFEFSYTQAPRTAKSMIFGLFMASVAIGNLFISFGQFLIINDDGSTKLAGRLLLLFSGLMFLTAVIFYTSYCQSLS